MFMAALAAGANAAPTAHPKNIIFFVGDGMGINALTAARIYAVGEDGEMTLDTLPESAFVKTFSNDGQAAESAAGMSAYMTGKKVNNEVVAMHGGRALTSLAELAKRRGAALGVVTTTRVTDATPAAVFAHVRQRQMEADIAAALVPGGAGYNRALGPKGIDVLLGGGTRHFLPATRADGRDLLAELRAKGYRVALDGAQFDAIDGASSAPLVGLFAPGDLAYDAVRDPAREPGLAAMTAKALSVLAQHPQGFLLVVEGGMIDVALHDSHAKRALQEITVLDTTLKATIAQMQARDPGLKNTLIVVTADHDHTMMLNGYARRTGKTTATEPGVLGLVRKVADGAPRVDADGMPFTIIGFGVGEHRVTGKRSSAPALTDAIVTADDYRQEAAVRSVAGDEAHGGVDVYLGAIGAGAGSFKGTIDNTRVFELIKAAAGW